MNDLDPIISTQVFFSHYVVISHHVFIVEVISHDMLLVVISHHVLLIEVISHDMLLLVISHHVFLIEVISHDMLLVVILHHVFLFTTSPLFFQAFLCCSYLDIIII